MTPSPPPRSVKASHVLISADGKVYLSGLRSNLSMISHGQRQRVVHDFPKYSIKVLPWLSPEVLQQVCELGLKEPPFPHQLVIPQGGLQEFLGVGVPRGRASLVAGRTGTPLARVFHALGR